MSKQPASRKQSATILHFKLLPDDERFASRNFMIGLLFLKFGCAAIDGEIDPDDDHAVVDKARYYSWVVQAICEMPNEEIDELRKFLDELEWGDKPAQVLQYANDYIRDEWSDS